MLNLNHSVSRFCGERISPKTITCTVSAFAFDGNESIVIISESWANNGVSHAINGIILSSANHFEYSFGGKQKTNGGDNEKESPTEKP